MCYIGRLLKNTGFQDRARPLFVPRHFGDEQGKGIELELIADALDELDLHFPPIEVAVEIEKMDLEQWRPVIDRRPGAKARDRRKGAPVNSRHDSINAMRKPVGRLERDIRRRHAKRTPQTLARNHLA